MKVCSLFSKIFPLCIILCWFWRMNTKEAVDNISFSICATAHCGFVFCSPLTGLEPPSLRSFLITHNDEPQSVGLLWTSDKSVAETSTWQHTTLTTDKHPCPGGIRTHDRSRRAAVDLRLKSRGHWDRQPNSNYATLFTKAPSLILALVTFIQSIPSRPIFLR